MRPLLGSRMQAMQCSSVVLPEPLGPIKPTTWPGKTSILISRRASTRAVPCPNVLDRCSTRTTACLEGAAMMLPRRRQRFGGVDLERQPDAECTGGKTDHDGNAKHDCDICRIQYEPSRKVGFEGDDEHQPHEVTEYSHR